MTLRESGGPLSPNRILLHMRNINGQIGNGSQEDAHEFLRSALNDILLILMKKKKIHIQPHRHKLLLCCNSLGHRNGVFGKLEFFFVKKLHVS